MEKAVAVDAALVKHVASLAHLSLTEAEVVYYQHQLARILDYIAQLSSVTDSLGEGWRSDTEGASTPERPDAMQPSLPIEEALSGAPRKIGTAFQVPRIIE